MHNHVMELRLKSPSLSIPKVPKDIETTETTSRARLPPRSSVPFPPPQQSPVTRKRNAAALHRARNPPQSFTTTLAQHLPYFYVSPS